MTRARHLIIVLALSAGCDRAVAPAPQREAQPERPPLQAERAPAPRPPAPAELAPGATSIADIAERSVASVVNIASEKRAAARGPSPLEDPFFHYFFGPRMPRERQERALGSGVIVSADGVVLTNNHVISQADRIRVTLSDGRELDAEIVGTDPESDVGVLRLKGDLKDLRPMAWGDSSALRLGEVVLAIGNPFGVGQTVTMGIVSAKGRANMGIVDYEDFIQTDAAINPGNSGGALVDLRGNLVGINTAIISQSGGYMGIGFAIPSNMAKGIANSLLTTGRVVRGWLGVAIQDVDRDLAQALKLPTSHGVLVADVTAQSPAAKAGLEQGDVIVKVDGKEVTTSAQLRNLIAAAGANAKVTLDVIRNGNASTLTVNLAEKPADPMRPGQTPPSSGESRGLSLAPLDAATQRRFELPPGVTGVVVVAVAQGSAAERAGFRPGDVIRAINREAVSTPQQARAMLSRGDEPVAVLVQRGQHTLYLALQPN